MGLLRTQEHKQKQEHFTGKAPDPTAQKLGDRMKNTKKLQKQKEPPTNILYSPVTLP